MTYNRRWTMLVVVGLLSLALLLAGCAIGTVSPALPETPVATVTSRPTSEVGQASLPTATLMGPGAIDRGVAFTPTSETAKPVAAGQLQDGEQTAATAQAHSTEPATSEQVVATATATATGRAASGAAATVTTAVAATATRAQAVVANPTTKAGDAGAGSAGTGPTAGTQYAFPVQPLSATTYGAYHHDYPATDIFCPIGSLFVAPTSGVVDYVSTQDTWDPKVDDPATRGGLSVAIIGDDGVRYYGSHLSAVQPGIVPGVRVKVGQALGHTGKSGDARYVDPHLHFGISPPTSPTDWKTRRGTVSPYEYLRAWATGKELRPVVPHVSQAMPAGTLPPTSTTPPTLTAAATPSPVSPAAGARGTTTEDGINLRTGPGTDSEIVAQLPADTPAQILTVTEGWYNIRTPWQSQGWVASDFFKIAPMPAGNEQLAVLGSAATVGIVNLRSGPGTGNEIMYRLADSMVLEVLELGGDWYKVLTPTGETGWVAAENVPLDWIPKVYGGSKGTGSSDGNSAGNGLTELVVGANDAVRVAQKYLGARYLWGGADPGGFDCSGLVWYVYRRLGVSLPGGSVQQFSSDYGRYISSISKLTPGDLVFFERTTEEAGITHVGIFAGEGKMIAARSERLGVRYVSLLDPFWSSRFVGGIRPYR